MYLKIALFISLFFSVFSSVWSQEALIFKRPQQCVFSSKTLTQTDLYQFSTNDKVTEWVNEILILADADSNFELIQTNVENVSAVKDNGKRYLLYSLNFIEKASSIEIYGALAHEIGHHLNEHTLSDARRKIEEEEADYFMGFILSKKGFANLSINGFLRKMTSTYNIPISERNKNVFRGFNKADISIDFNKTNKSLPWDSSEKPPVGFSMPVFPFPPPSCYTRFEVPATHFKNLKSLSDVDQTLKMALDKVGYSQRSYFYIPNGFALVTQLEQYNVKDATIRNDGTRWLDYPKQEGFEGIMSYISSLVMPNKGYFRLFIFLVTNEPFGVSRQKVSKTEASAWLNQGFNKLPNEIKFKPYTEGYGVTALVYEFEVPESNLKAKQVCPTPLFNAQTHMQQAGIKLH